MAKRFGITRNYLALIETGKRPVPASVAERLVTYSQQSNSVRESVDLHMTDSVGDLKKRIAELEAELVQAKEIIHNQSIALAGAGRANVIPAAGACVGDVRTERKVGA